MTDIHCHLIWGVDDGAETEEETVQMLQAAAADGIDRAICTPHVTPGVEPFPEERFQRHLEAARELIRKEGLNLRLEVGAEILYTEHTHRFLQEKRVATLAGTRYALVEFLPTNSWEEIRNALQQVYTAGVIPVIAHMERYPAIHRIAQVTELKERVQALVQINARTLIRRQSFFRGRFLDELFRRNLVDFIATDTHALPGRQTCLTEAMNALRKKYGEESAVHILRETEACFGGG